MGNNPPSPHRTHGVPGPLRQEKGERAASPCGGFRDFSSDVPVVFHVAGGIRGDGVGVLAFDHEEGHVDTG